MNRTLRILAAACGTAALAACNGVGPNFTPSIPATADSRNFLDIGKPTPAPVKILAGATSAPVDVQWWHVFRDPVLSRLESRIADQNLDVITATLRVAESRSQVASTAAAALPTLSGTASDNRFALSQNTFQKLIGINQIESNPAVTAVTSNPQVAPILQNLNRLNSGFNIYSVGFDAAWELDLWGHVARQIEAADAQLIATAEMRRDTLVSSLAELARDYINLRGTQAQIRIAKDNLKVEQEILNVTQVRQQKGLVTGLDVETAAAQVESVKAQVPPLDAQEVQQINAISLLLGEPPLALSQELVGSKAQPPNPPRVPVGLPSELARRRPDIRMAEAQLHAATANIGVAIAEFYPSVSLNASPSFQALEPKDVFKGTSLQYFTLGPQVTLPIFEGGKLKANLVLQEKTQQAAAVMYHKAVLSAWHDVVNALTSYKTEQMRRERLKAQVEHARAALTLARARYDQGVADFTTLLTDARTVLDAEQQYAQSTTNVSVDLIALYKALGGGWELTYPDQGAIQPPTLLSTVQAALPALPPH